MVAIDPTTGRRRPATLLLTLLPVALLATILLAAVRWPEAAPTSAPGDERAAQGTDVVSVAVRREAETLGLRMPARVALTSPDDLMDRLRVSPDGAPATFERGFRESLFVDTWRCAWERAYLDADDGVQRRTAWRALLEYPDLPLVQQFVQRPQLWVDAVVQPALDGDLGPMRDDVTHNCAEVAER